MGMWWRAGWCGRTARRHRSGCSTKGRMWRPPAGREMTSFGTPSGTPHGPWIRPARETPRSPGLNVEPRAERGASGTPSPDGRWVVRTERITPPPRPEPPLSDFEPRHRERFQGADFDWYPFRQDGQPFPLPDPADRAASELFLEPSDGSASPGQLTRLGLQPGNLQWLPTAAPSSSRPTRVAGRDRLPLHERGAYRASMNASIRWRISASGSRPNPAPMLSRM